MSLAVPARPSVIKSEKFIERVKIHSELQIPAACDEFLIYNELKHTLQETYRVSPWFWVQFLGLGTQKWTLDARLHIGARYLHRNFRSKIRTLILDSFKAHLSHDQFRSFQEEFSKNRKALQIEEDVAPFTEDKQHSWTRDGLPDIEDMNASLFYGPAAASIPSIPAPGGATQLTSASVPGSASISTLLPAGSRLPDGSSGPATPPASPPLTGLRRPRASASPPAPDKPGPPGSANKTAPKTPRTSEAASRAASRELPFGAGGPAAGCGSAATVGSTATVAAADREPSPPLAGAGVRRQRGSPPAPDKPGPPLSANKNPSKTPRTSESGTSSTANRGLSFGAGGPASAGPAATVGQEPHQSQPGAERSEPKDRGGPGDPSTSTPAPPSAGAAAVAPAETRAGQGLPVGRCPAAAGQPPADGSRGLPAAAPAAAQAPAGSGLAGRCGPSTSTTPTTAPPLAGLPVAGGRGPADTGQPPADHLDSW
jgi:hypothetical protein